MIAVQLACGHTVYRNPPGLRVPLNYKHCGEQQVVLQWIEVKE
jgi:hypothetical protein